MIVNKNTWIISDTHWGHKNIVKYCSRPKDHDTRMLRNWLRLVKRDDVVLHLGDVIVWYGSEFTWADKVKKLPGNKYLILGNHDKHFTNEAWLKYADMTVIEPFQQNKVYFSHELQIEGTWEVNIHGHSHNHAPFNTYMSFGSLYYNASIEGMRYAPRRLGTILKEIANYTPA